MQYTKFANFVIGTAAAILLLAQTGHSQNANPAPQPPQPPRPAGPPPGMVGADADSALGQKAASRWMLAPVWAKMPDVVGHGPYPATYAMAPDGLEDVVYQPKDLSQVKGELAVYIWGNGGCAADGAGARFHLAEIASHGYVAIAPGLILSGPKAPPQPPVDAQHPPAPRDPASGATSEKMTAALDWILAENKRPGSPYFGKIDPNRVAIAGYSCGGLIAMRTAIDPRARALIIESSGVLNKPPEGQFAGIAAMSQMKKEDLSKFHTPVLYILGGPQDVAEPNGLDDFKHIQQVPVFVADAPGVGHANTFLEPNGEGTKIELDWLDWHFNGDRVASRTFVGPECTLCRDYRWVVYRKGIE